MIGERNPLALFDPYPQQHELLGSRARARLFLAGTQTGKTTIGLVDDLIQACDRETVPSHLVQYKVFEPPFFARLMTPDFDHTMDQVLLPKLRALVPKDQLARGNWSQAYDKRHRVLRFKNGSWFQFASYKQDVSDLGGATLHRSHYDESPPKDHRTESKMRLVRHGGQELYTLTPVEGISHWLHEEFWEPWERGERDPENAWIVTASMDDNPYLTAQDIEWVLAGQSDEEREARRHGKFVALHGLIYNDFDRKVHVVPATELPENVRVLVGIDPGARYAAGAVWCAIDSYGKWRVFEELKMPGLNVEMMCERIHRLNAKWDVEPDQYIIDPSARNIYHHTGRSDQDLYAEHGIRTIAGQNDVAAGIKRVRQMFTLDDGVPRLVIYDHCEELIREILKYRWKDPPLSGEETRNAPQKKDDHLCFVSGTMVMTENGEKPIEQIQVGDRVMTRAGLRPVFALERSGEVETRELRLADGRTLRGTPDHPIWTEPPGWRPLCEVESGMCVGSNISGTPIDKRESSGESITEKSRRDMRFTTATLIPSTIGSRISNVSRRKNIRRFIRVLLDRSARKPMKRLRLGIARRLVGNGILHRPGLAGQIGSRFVVNASGVGLDLTASQGVIATASAGTTVGLRLAGPAAWMMNNGPAQSAEASSRSTDTVEPELAPVRVLANTKAPPSEVYNLTVQGRHEYFANGILVSNCDPFRYVVMHRPYAPAHEPDEDTRPPTQKILEADIDGAWGKRNQPMHEFGALI